MRRILLLGLLALGLVPVLPAAETLTIDKTRSRIEADVKATMDSFTGQLQDYDAQIAVDPAAGRVTAATVRFRVADFKTGKASRDEKMNDWQDTAHHPDATFTLDKLEPAADGRFRAHGRFTFHGVTQPLDFPVSLIVDHATYAIDGEVPVDTRRFDLPVIRVMAFLKVDPTVRVHFHLQGTLPR